MKETLNVKELFEALRLVAKQNLLTLDEIKKIIETAVFKSFHTKFDPDAELELIIDEANERFVLINNSKMVVEDEEFNDEYSAIEIALSDAKKIKVDAKPGDLISAAVDFTEYSKPVAMQIRQMITQSVKERKKEAVWEKHQSLKGEMIDVVVSVVTPNYVIFQLEDGTSAFMPSKLRNVRIPLKINERVKVYVEDVLKESKDSQIVVSNGSPILVRRVLETEVPEIVDGTIEIVNISRIAGERSKVAVKSNVEGVDPVGSIIGAQGRRITAITEKLQGEKIDVILYSPDINTFISNALAPSRVIGVLDKELPVAVEGEEAPQAQRNHKVAVVPNKHHTLAIGRGGSNARLAVELVNARVDIVSLADAQAQGLNFTWNGNITPAEVEALEAGQQIARKGARPASSNNRSNNSQSKQTVPAGISASLFDADITSFNEAIEDVPSVSNQSFEIDEKLFSEEELRAMEANFEFDDELGDGDELATWSDSEVNENSEEDEE